MKFLIGISALIATSTLYAKEPEAKRSPASENHCEKVSAIINGVSGGLQIALKDNYLILLVPKSDPICKQAAAQENCHDEAFIARVQQLALAAYQKNDRFCFSIDDRYNGSDKRRFSLGPMPSR